MIHDPKYFLLFASFICTSEVLSQNFEFRSYLKENATIYVSDECNSAYLLNLFCKDGAHVILNQKNSKNSSDYIYKLNDAHPGKISVIVDNTSSTSPKSLIKDNIPVTIKKKMAYSDIAKLGNENLHLVTLTSEFHSKSDLLNIIRKGGKCIINKFHHQQNILSLISFGKSRVHIESNIFSLKENLKFLKKGATIIANYNSDLEDIKQIVRKSDNVIIETKGFSSQEISALVRNGALNLFYNDCL